MVNHSKWYKDPRTKVHTNYIEGAWGSMKLKFRKGKGINGNLKHYLDEFMFWKLFIKEKSNAFSTIAKCVGNFYKPGM